MRLVAVGSAVCCTLCLTSPARAQRQSFTRELTLAADVSESARLDGVVSPSPFAGRGVGATIGFSASNRVVSLQTVLHGETASLSSSSVNASRERATGGALTIAALSPRQRNAPASTAVGGIVDVAGSVVAHRYTDFDARAAWYLSGRATVGPMVEHTRNLGSGVLTLAASTAVAGIVAEPYSVARMGRSAVNFHWATPATLQSAAAAISFAPRARRAIDVVYGYRLGMARYDGVNAMRGFTQTLSIGIARRSGPTR